MLEAALGEQLAAEGYGDGEWQLDSIESIEPVNPRFEGSRMYDGLAFDLRVKRAGAVATRDARAPAADAAAPPPTAEAATEAPAEAASAMPTAPDEPLPTPTEVPREWVATERTVTLDVYKQVKAGWPWA